MPCFTGFVSYSFFLPILSALNRRTGFVFGLVLTKLISAVFPWFCLLFILFPILSALNRRNGKEFGLVLTNNAFCCASMFSSHLCFLSRILLAFYMCLSICIYTQICEHIYVNLYICVYICTHVYLYTYIY